MMNDIERVLARPEPDEKCTCGQPAAYVFITEQYGRVPHCGLDGDR